MLLKSCEESSYCGPGLIYAHLLLASGNGYIGKGGIVKPTPSLFIMSKKVIVPSHLEIEHGLRFFWSLLDI